MYKVNKSLYYSTSKVAEIWGTTRATINKWIKEGLIPSCVCVKVGTHNRILKDYVESSEAPFFSTGKANQKLRLKKES